MGADDVGEGVLASVLGELTFQGDRVQVSGRQWAGTAGESERGCSVVRRRGAWWDTVGTLAPLRAWRLPAKEGLVGRLS